MLGQKTSLDADEQEFNMAMIKSWEEGKAEARAETRVETLIQAILTVLSTRGIEVPAAARDVISVTKDATLLNRWLAKAVVVSSIAELLGDAK